MHGVGVEGGGGGVDHQLYSETSSQNYPYVLKFWRHLKTINFPFWTNEKVIFSIWDKQKVNDFRCPNT